jgi:hypothetical protein
MTKAKQTEQAPADRPAPKFDGKYVVRGNQSAIGLARAAAWDAARRVWCYELNYLTGGTAYSPAETELRPAVGDAERFVIALHRRQTELATVEARAEALRAEIEAMKTTLRIIGAEPDPPAE